MAARKKTQKAKRTVLYSRSGKKLYAKRNKTGQFKDIQSYKRAHSADLKRKSKAEKAAAATKAKKTKKSKKKAKAKGATRHAKPKAAAVKRVAKSAPQKQASAAAKSYAIAPKPAVSGENLELPLDGGAGAEPVEVPAVGE